MRPYSIREFIGEQLIAGKSRSFALGRIFGSFRRGMASPDPFPTGGNLPEFQHGMHVSALMIKLHDEKFWRYNGSRWN